MNGVEVVEASVQRERWIVAGSLAVLVLLCWLYLAVMADAMSAMTGAGGSTELMWLMPMGAWGAGGFLLACAMWIVMMIGMMVPSAAPMILLYALIGRREHERGRVLPPTAVFLAGYLAVWSAFSVVAAALQFGLTEARLMSDLMESRSATFGAAVLILAGLYQLTPWKSACLAHCRSPIAFLTQHWRPGLTGTFRMGLSHGAYCVGCCWAVMSVLFVVGVMNLAWIAALSAFALVEKILPWGHAVARTTGALLLGAGVVVLARSTM